MNNIEFAKVLLCEAVELLNEGIFFSKPIKIYDLSISDKPYINNIFGLPHEKDEVLDYLDSNFHKDNDGKYILHKKASRIAKFYLYEHTVKRYKKSSQDNGKYHRDLYHTSNEKDVISSRLVKTFDGLEELVKYVGKEIVETDQSDERKKIVKIALSKLRAAKLYGVKVTSNSDYEIEDFICGDQDSAILASIDFTDLYDDWDKVNKYTKEISDELKNINKLINNKKYKLDDDCDKLEGFITLDYKH